MQGEGGSMRLDVGSIAKAAAWGLVVAIVGSLLFRLVHVPRVEAIFNVVLGGGIGFLFGRFTIRHGGDDGYSAMAVGGALAAVVPVVIKWMSGAALGAPGAGALDFTLYPPGVFYALVFGGSVGVMTGLAGALIYASRF
jgi:hypothetical protein